MPFALRWSCRGLSPVVSLLLLQLMHAAAYSLRSPHRLPWPSLLQRQQPLQQQFQQRQSSVLLVPRHPSILCSSRCGRPWISCCSAAATPLTAAAALYGSSCSSKMKRDESSPSAAAADQQQQEQQVSPEGQQLQLEREARKKAKETEKAAKEAAKLARKRAQGMQSEYTTSVRSNKSTSSQGLGFRV